jgi:cytochrome b561
LAIYAFILAECLLGWIIVNAKGFAIPLPLTSLEFPRLVAADPALVITAIWAHDVLAWMLYGLLALHIGAALWHHYVSRDDTLARMRLRVRKQRQVQAQIPDQARAHTQAQTGVGAPLAKPGRPLAS